MSLVVHANVPSLEKIRGKNALANAVAIEAGGLIFFSGLSGYMGQPGDAELSFAEQARNSLRKNLTALAEVGYGADHVIKVTAHLKNPSDFREWNAIFKEFFAPPMPCRTSVCAPIDGLVEVEIIAATEPRREQTDARPD